MSANRCNPGNGIVRAVARDEGVTNARQHLVSNLATTPTQRADIGARHRRPDEVIGIALCDKYGYGRRKGAGRVLRQKTPPWVNVGKIVSRKEVSL